MLSVKPHVLALYRNTFLLNIVTISLVSICTKLFTSFSKYNNVQQFPKLYNKRYVYTVDPECKFVTFYFKSALSLFSMGEHMVIIYTIA